MTFISKFKSFLVIYLVILHFFISWIWRLSLNSSFYQIISSYISVNLIFSSPEYNFYLQTLSFYLINLSFYLINFCFYCIILICHGACTVAVFVFPDSSSGPWTQRGAPLPYCCSAVAAALRRVSAAVAACGSTALWGGEAPLHSPYLEYNWATSHCKSSQSTAAAVGFVVSLI